MNRPTTRPALGLAALALLSLPAAASAQRGPASSRSATLAAAPHADADTARAGAHLLAPSEARRGKPGEPGRNSAELRYFLRSAQRAVTLEILDGRGRVIRTIDSTATGELAPPTTEGHHRVTWDLRHDAAIALEGAAAHPGPMALPGSYRVRLTVNGDTTTRSARSLVVHADPRSAVTTTDRAEQHAFLVRALARSNEARDAVQRIHRVRTQLAEREARVPDTQRVRWQVLSTVLRERLERIERELHGARADGARDRSAVIEQLAGVAEALGRAERRPGPVEYTALTTASMELDKRVIELREEMQGNLARVNDLLTSSKLEPIAP